MTTDAMQKAPVAIARDEGHKEIAKHHNFEHQRTRTANVCPTSAADWVQLGVHVLRLREDKRPGYRWQDVGDGTPVESYTRAKLHDGHAPLVGVLTGYRFDVLDLDDEQCWDDLAKGGDLPMPYGVARTRSGGWHVYLPPMGRGNGADLLKTGRPHGNIDYRGRGGFVVAPPSAGWTWESELNLADPYVSWGAWRSFLNRLAPAAPVARPTAPVAPVASTSETHPWVTAKLQARATGLAGATEGSRNHALNAAAVNIGHYVPHCLARADVEAALTDAARACGLPDFEIRQTLRSGLEFGMREPLNPPPTLRKEATR